jgi:hypothetical protein
MAARDHIYTWDAAQNATFPAKVTATGGFADYNNGTPTKFGYSTTGLAYNATSWLAAWDTSVSGEYRLRAINAANLRQFTFGTSAIGGTKQGIYYNGSQFTACTESVGSVRRPIYLDAGTATMANYTVAHFGNASKSNMNDIGRMHASSGMTNLSAAGNTTDNPYNGNTESTGWHLYWSTNYTDDPNGSNSWVA